MIVPSARLCELAYGEYALGAYNVNNREQVLGLFEGQQRARGADTRCHCAVECGSV
jgi:fructose-bisphosphate aldolase, class II